MLSAFARPALLLLLQERVIGPRVGTRVTETRRSDVVDEVNSVIIAGVGVLLGALTSNGLMEVARRGVFDPSWFMTADGTVRIEAILAIYLGVMAADVFGVVPMAFWTALVGAGLFPILDQAGL